MSTAVCILAAGAGERLRAGVPKALALLAGEPLLVHAVRGVLGAREVAGVAQVVVAVPAGTEQGVRAQLASLAGVGGAGPALDVVAGGPSRAASVARALAALDDDVDVVLVHDAARPLTPPSLVDAVVAAVRAGAPAVVPGLPLADTVKQVDAAGTVVGTPARQHLRAVQTPQGFRRDVLERAYAEADLRGAPAVTDDAGLVELLDGPPVPVRVVPGAVEALKVTTPADLVLAEALLAARRLAGTSA
jgi:2-C-methyl-D-erythritol 4-phosphate cytidylyltransferase